MIFQPLAAQALNSAQQVAASLFPWEDEHGPALAAALHGDEARTFCARRGLASVRCWTAGNPAGDIAGLATLYHYQARPDECWLAWFGLLPAARGNGNGAKLLDWTLAQARAEGCRTMRLWTTNEQEYERAACLYRRRGFIAEDHPALPGEDWRTIVYSLGLDGSAPLPWSAVADRGELCGRVHPLVAAVAA